MRLLKYVIYIGMLAAALALGSPKWKILVIALISSGVLGTDSIPSEEDE